MLRPRMCGACLGLVLVAAVCLPFADAQAQQASSETIAILPFDGAGGDTVRDALVRELGQRGLRAEARVAGSTQGVGAIVEGDVRRRGRRRTLTVTARAADGASIGEWSATRRDADDLAPAIADRAADALAARLAAPSVATPAATAATDTPRPYRFGDAPADERTSRRASAGTRGREAPSATAEPGPYPTAFEITIGMRSRSRNLSYNDDLFAEHSGYDIAGTPIVIAEATFFPGAMSRSAAAHVGVEGRAEVSVGVSSERDGGASHATRFHALSGALVVRLPLGPMELRPHAGYGIHDFTFAGGDDGQAPVPDVRYEHLAFGTSILVHAGSRLDVHARGAWLPVLSLGDIGSDDWFPHATAGGVEAELGLTLWLADGLGIRVAGEWRRFFLSMNPEPGEAHVAGGAVDQYLGGSIALSWQVR